MRKLIPIIGIVVLMCLSGCSVNQIFQQALEKSMPVIEDRLEKYIENDPTLTDETKVERKATVQKRRELIQTGKE